MFTDRYGDVWKHFTPWGCLMFMGMSNVYKYAGNISHPGDVWNVYVYRYAGNISHPGDV